jgi:thioesterase domain-containing protein
MVNDYLEQVLATQKEGPYFLLGWSFGGVVAHAVAVELNRRGHEVAWLALVASAPAPGNDSVMPAQSVSDSDLLGALSTLASERYGITIDDPVYEPFAKNIAAVMKNNAAIMKDFVSPIYQGPSILFIPTIDEPWSPERHVSEWAAHLKGPIAVHLIEDTHAGMDRPESLAAIGQILDRTIA